PERAVNIATRPREKSANGRPENQNARLLIHTCLGERDPFREMRVTVIEPRELGGERGATNPRKGLDADILLLLRPSNRSAICALSSVDLSGEPQRITK